jgi:hypothetical protein
MATKPSPPAWGERARAQRLAPAERPPDARPEHASGMFGDVKGEVGVDATYSRGVEEHLTLPVALATGPLPLPTSRGEGMKR